MNYIESVDIYRFWGDKTVHIEFSKTENFIVGVNGSGKTTIINLIVAALKLDFQILDAIEFEKIIIKLKSFGKARFKPVIEIIKEQVDYSLFTNLALKIKYSAKDEPIEFSLNELEEEKFIRRRRLSQKYIETIVSKKDNVFGIIKELSSISWLSINRFNNKSGSESYEPSVDRKLDELSNKFIRYFSALQSKVNEETELFQKQIFLSLLSDETEGFFRANDSIDSIVEMQSIKDIFSEFNVPEKQYIKKLEKHFVNYEHALNQIKNKQGLNFNHAAALISTNRIHKIVQQWSALELRKREIFRSRDLFLDIVNSLFQRKKLIFSKNNDFIVKTQSNKEFSLKKLSSGEKQLIIILGEALLQNSTPHVYIADEPELSLHVAWQEKLVKSIREINSNAQIIFATHSPDIVGEFSDSIIYVEDCIKNIPL